MIPDLSLAKFSTEVELVCREIDECGGEITADLFKRLADQQGGLARCVDDNLKRLDAVKMRIEYLKLVKERISHALKLTETYQSELKLFLKDTMQATPNFPYRGSLGSLRLQRNPKSLKISFERTNVTVYKVVAPGMLALVPSLAPYLSEVKHLVIDADKLKADLEAGVQLPWATLETNEYHVRTQV